MFLPDHRWGEVSNPHRKLTVKPRDIYHKLCEAEDLRSAVRALSCEDLTAVAGYLSGLKNKGIAAQVWGEVQEALTREVQP